MKFIRFELQCPLRREKGEDGLKLGFVAWRRKIEEEDAKKNQKEKQKRKMKKWMTVSNYWIIVDIVEIVFITS